MMKKLLTVIFVMLSLTIVEAQKIVGYLPSYRDPSTSNIQYSKVNTILYAFINPDATGNLITTTGLGANWDFSMTNFLTVKSNCTTYGTKLYISCGGADAGNQRSARLDAVCGNSTYRATLVSQLVQFAITHNLAGIDIDWEFPTTTTAQTHHESLLADLRAAINASTNPAIRIGVAVGGEYVGGINHLNYFNANAVQYVDDFHLMTYDFPVSYNTNHATLADAQASFNQWNSAKGVPKAKMYMGVPFYGRDASHNSTSDYRNFSVGAASYNVDTYGGYYYNGKTTLETKASWVVAQGGQGIMIWDLGQDRTSANGYTLLDVIYNQMSTICPAPQPDLGPDVGFCSGTVTLNSSVAQASGRTFTWKLNGTAVVTNSATANTYTASAGGTYIVEVNQSSCTKTDQIVVTAGSSVGVTNAVRCGPGSVTLSVNASSGTYDWYTASTGGTLLNTGLNYTFNETASNTYYVQQNTGSVTYSGGKAVIDAPNAANEAGYESTNSLPRFAHKMVVSSTLTIQSVKIWTSNNATTGVKVMVMKSIDGTSIQAQTTPVNLTAGGSPYTLAVNITLTPGTYYIGVYAPVAGYPGAGIWLDPTPVASSQSGVYSIEAASYANYSAGFNATQTPTKYGQLFDWVITTGIVPPCGRTPVTTTINGAANTGLTVSGTTPICAGIDGTVTVQTSEANVSYQPYIGTNTVGAAVSGTGSNLNLTVDNPNLIVGTNTITVKGTKSGCGTVALTNTASIVVNASSAAAITFGNVSKTYGNAAFSLSASSASPGAFTYSLVSSNPASIVTVASNGLVTISGAGTATVKVDQAANGCYSAGSATATLTINKATLTATADNQSRAYGAANPTFTFTYSGFVNSETASVIDVVPTASTAATATSNVGTYTITAAGGSDNNYAISLVNGTLTITKATITATATNQSRAYGAANPTFTFTYTGFVNGETSSVIDVVPTASTTATSTSNVGTYTITAAGGSDNNYNITLANGTLTVTKVTITATANNQSRIYGSANPTFTFTYTGFVNGETSSVIDVLPTASTSATATSNVGTYTITAAGGSDNNYNITLANGTLTITKATITATADNQSRAYGAANPTFTFTYSGFVNGETSSVIDVLPTASTTATSTSNVGTYTITAAGGSDNNYNITLANGTLTVTKVTITATANNQSRIYGSANPTFTFTYTGFVNGETSSVIDVLPTASTSATATSNVGTYTITAAGGSDNNYNITLANGTLTITKATVTATADNQSRAYGVANPTFTFTYTGFVNGETSSVIDAAPTASTTATTSSNVGTYTITAAGGSDNNYNITLANGTLTIIKANRSVTITSSSTGTAGGSIGLTYNTTPTGGVATWSETNGTGSASVSSSTLSLISVGTVTVQVNIAADVNYNATSTTQTVTISNLTTPTITFNGSTNVYGDAPFTMTATSNSAGAFTYSLVSSVPAGIVTVGSNGLITINGAGTATVKVDQVANGSFGPGSASATIMIAKANRTATITSANNGLVSGTISLTNTVSNGTGATTWSVTNGTGAATINATNLSLTVAGTVTVQVDIAADANYNATSATQTVTIGSLTSPTITYGNALKVYGDAPFMMTASSNSAGALTYSLVSSVPSSIVTVASNGQITINGAGTATIQVDQVANGSFSSGSTTATLTINKAGRTATITSSNSGAAGSTIGLTNTVSNGTGAVSWSVTNGTGAATLIGTTLSLTVGGTVTVQVDIAADANYLATSATQTVSISGSGSQTPQPGAFTAFSNNVTQGQTGVTYTIPNVPGTTYTWTYSGTGGTITGTGNSITMDFSSGSTSGTLSVVANDGSGNSIPRDLAINVSTATAVMESLANAVFKVYPNPFESSSMIYFEVVNSDQVKLEVFDLVGHKIETLINGSEYASGSYEVSLSNIPLGVYMVKLQIGSREQNIKIVKN